MRSLSRTNGKSMQIYIYIIYVYLQIYIYICIFVYIYNDIHSIVANVNAPTMLKNIG